MASYPFCNKNQHRRIAHPWESLRGAKASAQKNSPDRAATSSAKTGSTSDEEEREDRHDPWTTCGYRIKLRARGADIRLVKKKEKTRGKAKAPRDMQKFLPSLLKIPRARSTDFPAAKD